MPIQQILALLIVFPGGLLLATIIIYRGTTTGLPIMKYGLVVLVPSVGVALLEGRGLHDVLLFIDPGAATRAYMAGCLLFMTGSAVEAWRLIRFVVERFYK